MHDFYYSARQKRKDGNLCHLVQGKEFTEVVPTGRKPVGTFNDYVLVAKRISYDNENVSLNPKLYKQNPLYTRCRWVVDLY
jgi:hypothetical protein